MPPLRISLSIALLVACTGHLYAQHYGPFEKTETSEPHKSASTTGPSTQLANRNAVLIEEEKKPATFSRFVRFSNDSSQMEVTSSEVRETIPNQNLGTEPRARKLPPRNNRSESKPKEELTSNRFGPMVTGVGSLAIVLGLFLLLAWITKRNMPKASSILPSEVIEVLGRAPLASRQNMHLVRVGQKLLVLSVTPSGSETLTEITDPIEVERLSTLAQQSRLGSATENFRQVLTQIGEERAPAGFFGDPNKTDLEIANLGTADSRRSH